MTSQTRTVNKGRFEQGDTPQGSDYVDVFDSFLSLADTTAQTVTSQITVPTLNVTTKVSAVLVNASTVSASFIRGNDYGTVTAQSIITSGASFITNVSAGPSGAQGQALLAQAVTVASNTSGASNIRLPSKAVISQIRLIVMATASANTQGVNVRVGTSGDATQFASIKGSAANIYLCGVAPNVAAASVAAWKIGASNVQVHIDVSAAASAGQVDNFEGILEISYRRT